MSFQENEKCEFKVQVVDDIKKEIIAFANTMGGTLYVGIQDDGEVVGIDHPDEDTLKIANMVRDAIKPDVTMFIHYETLHIDGKNVIKIQVQRGTDRPYFLSKKGLRPEGVYVRQASSSVPASNDAIRQMIKETDGEQFEEMRTMEQSLTFNAVEKEFATRSLPFGPQQMRSLKLVDTDGLYTNLALLLSDQCPQTIKAACFQGTDKNIFRNRQEFTGSIMQQLHDVYGFIDIYNQTRSTFKELLRIDTLDYPKPAIREALLNLIVHRDYSVRASAFINIFSDRIEFLSVGGLMPSISMNDIMTGISVCRNQNLANIFYRLEMIEAYGTGIQKILDAYKAYDFKPKFEVTDNAFKTILPNVNTPPPIEVDSTSIAASPTSTEEKQIIEFAKGTQAITRADVENLLDTSSSTALRLLKKLCQQGTLLMRKKGRLTEYTLSC